MDQLQLQGIRIPKERLTGDNKLKKADLAKMMKEKLGI